MDTRVLFTRAESVADEIERLVGAAAISLDAALYRLDSIRLARSFEQAARRGVRVRLVLDGAKYDATGATQEILKIGAIPFRLAHGRQGAGSKMHHKFAILDQEAVLSGSYNWTLESEEGNYENLVILRDSRSVMAYLGEFEALWTNA